MSKLCIKERFTPGPWKNYNGDFVCEVKANGKRVADCKVSGDIDVKEIEKANAALIAAAPQMLAALKLAFKWMPCIERGISDDRQAVKEAIARAEGREA